MIAGLLGEVATELVEHGVSGLVVPPGDAVVDWLAVRERYLGTAQGQGLYPRTTVDIAQNQPLRFEWTASADSYGGIVAGFRYGKRREAEPGDPEGASDPYGRHGGGGGRTPRIGGPGHAEGSRGTGAAPASRNRTARWNG